MINSIAMFLGNVLGTVYGIIGNYGLSIIVFTLLVKIVLIPLSISQIRSTKNMQVIQPKLQELQKRYKNDKETLQIKTMELYKEYKVNPVGGCLPMLVQLPILFGLFRALREPATYVFAANPALAEVAQNTAFLWVKNLSLPDTLANVFAGPAIMATLPGLLPIIAAITTYVQMATMSPASGNDSSQPNSMKTMQYVMPFMILFMGRTLSGGLMIYWTVSNVFQMAQQYLTTKLAKGE